LRPSRTLSLLTILLLLAATSSLGQEAERNQSVPVTHLYTNVGLLGLAVNNMGYFGTAFNSRNPPSAEYYLNSNTEHIYRGGIWVGARDSGGELRVSTGAQDANGLVEGDEIREFQNFHLIEETSTGPDTVSVIVWSNEQNADNYNQNALATQHMEFAFRDDAKIESGNHVPLGLKVILRVLAWGPKHADDFVILDYAIINNNLTTGKELRDVYVGLWVDTTVGNTDQTNPYDPQAPVRWNFNDDVNGAWGAVGYVPDANTVPSDPDIWMNYEHDDDGEEGLATSWIGTRLLGTSREPEPEPGVNPVSYNAWRFRGVPEKDDWYTDPDDPNTLLPGKYQVMSNGAFTVGETQDVDYSKASNWVGLLTTGPFPYLAAGDTLRMTYAIVAGEDSVRILDNSKIAQLAYNNQFSIPNGPPSPRLNFSYSDNSVVLSWAPGDSVDADDVPLAFDSPLRSPEQHISDLTGRPDFQGYRIYRYQGLDITGDPFAISDLVAQFDIIDGVGYDTGMPPLDDEGNRVFVDTNLLDGFPYWYSVTSFSSPNYEDGFPEFESGYNSNSKLVYPGPAPAGQDNPRTIGVYPNPYRAGSMFDDRTGEQEINRRLWFTGLPARCRIQVFTLVGELVQTLDHDDPSSGQEPWDLLSADTQAIASGLYIYTVEDMETGEIQRGKLVIIK